MAADGCDVSQVKRVIDPEAEALRLAEMRKLQRQMKGVKLQYIAENDAVFFDDVAGIGEAKVCHVFAVTRRHLQTDSVM